MSELPPLAPDIASLLEREGRAYAQDPSVGGRVLSRVELAVGLQAAAATGGPRVVGTAKAAGVGKIVAASVPALVVGVGVGAQASRVLAPSLTQAAPSGEVSPPRLPTPPPMSPEPWTRVPEVAASVGSAVPPAVPSSEPPSAKPTPVERTSGDVTKEREILDAARAALVQGRPADALVGAGSHAERWPRGYLVEEREVLIIQALAADRRPDEALHRAAQFHARFPKSMLGPAVDVAVEGLRPSR